LGTNSYVIIVQGISFGIYEVINFSLVDEQSKSYLEDYFHYIDDLHHGKHEWANNGKKNDSAKFEKASCIFKLFWLVIALLQLIVYDRAIGDQVFSRHAHQEGDVNYFVV
jgi:hypothetical protein